MPKPVSSWIGSPTGAATASGGNPFARSQPSGTSLLSAPGSSPRAERKTRARASKPKADQGWGWVKDLLDKAGRFDLDIGDAGTRTREDTKNIGSFQEDIKKMLWAQILAQMKVKVSQTGIDTFLMQQKWKVEMNLTFLQYGATIAQMTFQYMVDMRQGWDRVWQKSREAYKEAALAGLK